MRVFMADQMKRLVHLHYYIHSVCFNGLGPKAHKSNIVFQLIRNLLRGPFSTTVLLKVVVNYFYKFKIRNLVSLIAFARSLVNHGQSRVFRSSCVYDVLKVRKVRKLNL
ncbi:hypothetical protein Hanom_Chr03g00200361 [Helianthus anomalus]